MRPAPLAPSGGGFGDGMPAALSGMAIFLPAAIAVASVMGVRRLARVLRAEVDDQDAAERRADDPPADDPTPEPPARPVLH